MRKTIVFSARFKVDPPGSAGARKAKKYHKNSRFVRSNRIFTYGVGLDDLFEKFTFLEELRRRTFEVFEPRELKLKVLKNLKTCIIFLFFHISVHQYGVDFYDF